MKNVKTLKPGQEFEVDGTVYEVVDKSQFVFCINKTDNKLEKFRPYTIVNENVVKNTEPLNVVEEDVNVVYDKKQEILDNE